MNGERKIWREKKEIYFLEEMLGGGVKPLIIWDSEPME